LSNPDARFIDPSLGTLLGEGSQQVVHQWGKPPGPVDVWYEVPTRDGDYGTEPTYYDKPALKSPVWIWSIPTYFFVGGVAGAAMVLGLATQIAADGRLGTFKRRCRWVGAVGGGVGSALLILDLGRKFRFLNMLRVFRPTSPMSVGSWVVAMAGPFAAGAAILQDGPGILSGAGELAGAAAGILGMPLAAYTAVLLSNTAVPVWSASRRMLPLLFAASSMASMAAVFRLMDLERTEELIVDRCGLVGGLTELAAAYAVEIEVGTVEQVALPLHEGVSGVLWKAAKVLTASAIAVSLLPGRNRAKRLTSGVLGVAGGLALRWAVFEAGKRSAKDPRATFRQQRAGFGAAEVTAKAAVTGSAQ
jgi:formate-dependent nitrite reductase membrane component NrfD